MTQFYELYLDNELIIHNIHNVRSMIQAAHVNST